MGFHQRLIVAGVAGVLLLPVEMQVVAFLEQVGMAQLPQLVGYLQLMLGAVLVGLMQEDRAAQPEQ